MPVPNAIDICRTDLFTSEDELRERFPDFLVQRVLRVREMYYWYISNPECTDRDFLTEIQKRHAISRVSAYDDLNVIKKLLPCLSSAHRDFHRWKYNEMILATFKMAEQRKDTKTMERAATSYAKLNRVDLEDEQAMPFHLIVPQPFTATDDPSVLGIKPIPDIDRRIAHLLEKYRKETADIDDVEFEEIDLEFDSLFPQEAEELPEEPEEDD